MARHGKNSYFSMQGPGGGAENNISTFLNDISLPMEIDASETTTFGGDGSRTYIPGLKDSTVSFAGLWETTVHAYFGDQSVTRTFTYGPAGNTNGLPKLTGTGILTSYEITGGVEDPVGFSAEMQVTGAVTYGTFS